MSESDGRRRDGRPSRRRIADAASPRPEPPPRGAAAGAASRPAKRPLGRALERVRIVESAPVFLPDLLAEPSAAAAPQIADAAMSPQIADAAMSPQGFDPASPMVSVVLEFLGAMRDLPALGAQPVGRAGHVVAAYANVTALGRLHEHPAVLRLEEGRAWALPISHPQTAGPTTGHDASVTSSGVENPARPPQADLQSSPVALTGRGVRLAVLDLGFDFLHPALLTGGADPQSRAVWLQDFGLSPEAGSVLPGRRFDQSDLQAALAWWQGRTPGMPPPAVEHLKRLSPSGAAASAEQEQMERHGTAVVGIAAGTVQSSPGSGADAVLGGVAPEAELALIAIAGSGVASRFSESTDMLAGFALAFADCSSPCVAIMANSDNLGPHDGTLVGERFLEELLLLPGRAVVVTIGNLNHGAAPVPGGRPAPAYHAVVHPPGAASETYDAVLELEFDEGCSAADVAEIWFHAPAGSDATAHISGQWFEDIFPTAIGPQAIPLATPGPVTVLDADKGSGSTLTATLADDPAAGARCLRIAFTPREGAAHSIWTITVTTQDSVHAWITRNNQGLGHWRDAPAQQGADHHTLGSPACAARLLSVGSLRADGSTPSDFSGRGPVRSGGQKKPDLVAIGEGLHGPLGSPADRLIAGNQPDGPQYIALGPGTSYAAPQVAGACALLFEHFGSAASWADLRQVLLESAHRAPAMPPADAEGWDNACGHGLLDLNNLLSRPTPEVDLWLASAAADSGFEPFVDWIFWASPDILAEDAEGQPLAPASIARGEAVPARLRAKVRNRGTGVASGAKVSLYWAPLGVLQPLPGHPALASPWQQTGLGPAVTLETIAPGGSADALFTYAPPKAPDGRVLPHMLLATVDHANDPFEPTEPLSARNNAAALSIAATGIDALPPAFTLLGSFDTDGAILWLEGGDGSGLVIEDLPVAALPWRDAGLFERQHWRGQRPRWGDAQTDPAAAPSEDRVLATPEEIEEVTDIQGARRVTLSAGRVRIEGGDRLVLPRLRLALGTALTLRAAPTAPARQGALHLLHLSGGRRIGGGTVSLGA